MTFDELYNRRTNSISVPEDVRKIIAPPQIRTHNILHLTDLHFDSTESESDRAMRVIVLDKLIDELGNLGSRERPTIVVISGDIAMRGLVKDYDDAIQWIERLLGVLQIGRGHLLVCPGNHDIIRKVARCFYQPINNEPETLLNASHLLEPQNIDTFAICFDGYLKCCTDLEIPAYALGKTTSYLTGVRVIDEVRFAIFNSAWFCRGKGDRGNLFLGRQLVDILHADNSFPPLSGKSNEPLSVAVMHHPREWLADSESTAYSSERGAFTSVVDSSHLVLAGHTHGQQNFAIDSRDGCPLIVGGSTFHCETGTSNRHGNYHNFVSLLQIDKDTRSCERKFWKWEGELRKWARVPKSQSLSLRSSYAAREVMNATPSLSEINARMKGMKE